MSDTPRNKVNISAICEANHNSVQAAIKVLKKELKEAQAVIESIKSRQLAELSLAQSDLSKNATLIQDVEREGLPAAKLHEKAKDISARITKLKSEHSSSKELADAQAALENLERDLKSQEELLKQMKACVEIAAEIKSAYEVSEGAAGAVDAPEFETIDEAVIEYVENIPVVVGFTKELNIDRVGFWQVPRENPPHVAKIFAANGKAYRLNRLPESLTWLKEFEGSPYSDMPTGAHSEFVADGVVFKKAENDFASPADSAVEREAGAHSKWMGRMDSSYAAPKASLFAPEGAKNYSRSGLCYVKSEGRFYSLWNNKYPCIKMVPGNVEYQQYGQTYTRPGQVPHDYEIDASALFAPFLDYVSKKLDADLVELNELQAAKSPLVAKIAKAVKSVGVIESTFEPRMKRLTSAEITKEVGAYWDAFVNAPWEGHISGDVAMLKHLCERKLETPHVWSYNMKGFYGLKVRTRDHDWINALMYCPPESLSPSDSISHDQVTYHVGRYHRTCQSHVRIGPCFLKVLGREK